MKHLNTAQNSLTSSTADENLITKKTLAEKLSLSISYINKLMKLGKIRAIKSGRNVRFRYTDVILELEKWNLA